MASLLFYPYPPSFDKDIELITEYCELNYSDSISVYQQLRKRYGELEWLTLNYNQKVKRIKDYRDNFLSF